MTGFATQATTEGVARLIVDSPLTIYCVAEFKDQLLGGLMAAPVLELDLSQVAEIDSAGLQLLLLAKRESQRHQRTMRIIAHSPAVRSAIDFCNLNAFFGDPMLIPADE
jgi:anti-anti-sigma factor